MKKRHLISIVAGCGLIVSACVFVSGNQIINVFSSDTCDWNHYLSTEPTYELNGNKEYWVCCAHHDYSLTKPTSGKGIDKEGVAVTTAQLLEIASTRDKTNSPFIPSYKEKVDEVKLLIDQLPQTNDLTVRDYDQIINTKRHYDNLPDIYKSYVTNYLTLENLINVYNDDFPSLSSNSSFVSKGSFDYAHTKDYQASIIAKQNDTYYGEFTQINFESFTEFKTYSAEDTWWYTPCIKINPMPIAKSYNNIMFYVYNPTAANQDIYLYKGYWIAADAKYKNEADLNETSSSNQVTLKSGWNRIIVDNINNVDFDNFVLGFCGKGQGTCESGWKITTLRGQIDHEFSGNY